VDIRVDIGFVVRNNVDRFDSLNIDFTTREIKFVRHVKHRGHPIPAKDIGSASPSEPAVS
jgi:hypothetical protein